MMFNLDEKIVTTTLTILAVVVIALINRYLPNFIKSHIDQLWKPTLIGVGIVMIYFANSFAMVLYFLGFPSYYYQWFGIALILIGVYKLIFKASKKGLEVLLK